MTSLFWETIAPEMRQVLTGFSSDDIGTRFYLAGGTALALQLGHRQSFDLDFFSATEDIPGIRHQLEQTLQPFSPILADSSWGNLVFLARGVRVGIFGHRANPHSIEMGSDAYSKGAMTEAGAYLSGRVWKMYNRRRNWLEVPALTAVRQCGAGAIDLNKTSRRG